MCRMTMDAQAFYPRNRFGCGDGKRLMWKLSGIVPVAECLKRIADYDGATIEAVVNVTKFVSAQKVALVQHEEHLRWQHGMNAWIRKASLSPSTMLATACQRRAFP